MDLMSRVLNLDEAICITFNTDAFGMGKLGSLALQVGKLNSKPEQEGGNGARSSCYGNGSTITNVVWQWPLCSTGSAKMNKLFQQSHKNRFKIAKFLCYSFIPIDFKSMSTQLGLFYLRS